MSLTVEQIAAIKAFINKRGFTTIEVEMEALDHLASKVESLLAENPEMDFEMAINKAHASFGIFGLSSIEESVTGSIQNSLKKRFFKELWSYFSSSKLVILILIFLFFNLTLYTISADISLKSLRMAWLLYGFCVGLIPYVYFSLKFKKWAKKSMTVQLSTMGFYVTYFILSQGMQISNTFDLTMSENHAIIYIHIF